jgi:hypothetical protein
MTSLLLINLVIATTLLEASCLLALWYLAGRGIHPRHYFANLCSGLALMLALRAALLDVHWSGVAGFLLLAGIFHGFQLAVYLKKSRTQRGDRSHAATTSV